MFVYIVGAGGMGSRFAVQMQETGQEVTLLETWEDNLQAIRDQGIRVSGDDPRQVRIPILKPEEASQTADLIILFVKSMQLEETLTSVQHLVGPETKVFCFLNGLGHEETLRAYIPAEGILMGVTTWTASLTGPGQVHLQGTGEINIAPSEDPKVQALVEMMNRAHLNVVYDDRIDHAIWRKACVNGAMNANCAVLDCRIGQLLASQAGQESVEEIIHEFVQVAQAQGVDLDEEEMIDYVFQTGEGAAHHYPSMHQDLVQNHRRTEIDYLNGYVAKKGRQHGIQTPYCRYITQLVHAKEAYLVPEED